jgi:hypothetical protein
MKTYPYISTTMNNLLFYAKDTATLIGDESNQFSHGFKLTVDESRCENNTHEYLSNTWGAVESKEHAEFIIELAELHGFELTGISGRIGKFFAIDDRVIILLDLESVASRFGLKITIPLPPKAKEWPQVGDEVEYRGAKFKVLMTADKSGHIVADDNGNYINPHIEDIKKPKSNQDLLIEELQTKLCNNNAVDNYILACDIINGEIEGLSYE